MIYDKRREMSGGGLESGKEWCAAGDGWQVGVYP